MKSIVKGLRLHTSIITFFITNSEWFFRESSVCWESRNLGGKPVFLAIPFQSVKAMYLEEKVRCYV